MNLIKKILAPTDLSPFSAKGVRYACHLAKAMQAQVTIAHVLVTVLSEVAPMLRAMARDPAPDL